MTRLRFWARTVAGRRAANQDAVAFTGFGLADDGEPLEVEVDAGARVHLALMADGVGGSSDGRWAARSALAHLEGLELRDASEASVASAVADAAARLSVHTRGPGAPATTLAGIALDQDRATVFNVGDTRVYSLSHGAARQLSVDHRSRTDSRAISRYLGGSPAHAIPTITSATLVAGSWFLLVTDGVHGFAGAADLGSLDLSEPGQACLGVIRKALAAGSEDNLSVGLVAVG